MVRFIIVPIVFMLSFGNGYTQNHSFIKKGLLRAQTTFAPGVMLHHNKQQIYLHADLEYYLERTVSLKSDTYIQLMAINGNKLFKHYYSNFIGAAYHLPVNNIDFFVSLQPGLSFIQSEQKYYLDMPVIDPKFQAVPMIGIGTGVNFYIHRFFHFMAHAKYIKGSYNGGASPFRINEFLFSAGLGWNVNTRK